MAYVKREMEFSGGEEHHLERRPVSLDSTVYGHLFRRNSNRTVPPVVGTNARSYEPAFIETDFTSPITRADTHRHVASAPPSLPLHRLPISAMQPRGQTGSVQRMTTDVYHSLRQARFSLKNQNPSGKISSNPLGFMTHELGRQSQRRCDPFPPHKTGDLVRRGFTSHSQAADLDGSSRQEVPAALQLTIAKVSDPGISLLNNLPQQSDSLDLSGSRNKTDYVHIPLPVLLHSAEQPGVGPVPSSARSNSNSAVTVPNTDDSERANDMRTGCRSNLVVTEVRPEVGNADFKGDDSFHVLDCSKKPISDSSSPPRVLEPTDDDASKVYDRDGKAKESPNLATIADVVERNSDDLSLASSASGGCKSDLASHSASSKDDGDAVKSDDQVQSCTRRKRTSTEGTSARSCMNALSLAAEGECEEEREFVWDDYLEDTKTFAAPPTSFTHVECSLQNGFEKGMKLEVANKAPNDSYWIASILMTCGQLLRLRPEGCSDDGSADFWCDILSSEVHQLGWSKENSKDLCPSDELRSKFPSLDWELTLKNSMQNARTPSLYMLDRRTGPLPIDQIKEGMFLEVQLENRPNHLWPVKIIENVGGRLLLRYELLETASDDFWLFYLHHRLHPIGWARSKDFKYNPPNAVLAKLGDSDWSNFVEQNFEVFQKYQPPPEILQDQRKLQPHHFVKGCLLEAVHPKTLSTIHPASVKDVVDEYFFIVELISPAADQEPVTMCCHAGSLNIFPVGWCSTNGISLGGEDFEWQSFLEKNSAKPAPKDVFLTSPGEEQHGLESGMKLEAVNPSQPGQICVASVTKVVEGVMWLRLDHNPASVPDQIVPIDTYDVFPIGWCESNNYPLRAPKIASSRRLPNLQSERHLEDEARNTLFMRMKEADLKKASGWCPKIYFNYRCFTGRYLSKGRLVLLPRSVGPGSVVLVMTTVLSKLVSVAYKSGRVLRELQLKGKPNANMQSQLLRAKYKGKSYSAIVEICTSSDQIASFCRDVCRRLECCPNLISTQCYEAHCPENCSRLVKGKHSYYFGQKKRKIGRPPGGHSNLDFSPKKPGRRRRHRKLLLTLRKKHGLVGRVTSPGHDEDESNSTGSWKCLIETDDGRGSLQRASRKRRRPNATTKVQTRGLKLPKYSFERTSEKVLRPTPVKRECAEFEARLPLIKEELLKLNSNPLYWSVQEVVEYIKTTDCASIARLFKDQEIDGQSLLLLSLPTVQEHLEPRLGPAVKLCHQIERLKVTFYHQYAS